MVLLTRLIDSRFTVTREYCGHPTPRWIVRFCGDWISDHADKASAEAARVAAIVNYRESIQ